MFICLYLYFAFGYGILPMLSLFTELAPLLLLVETHPLVIKVIPSNKNFLFVINLKKLYYYM